MKAALFIALLIPCLVRAELPVGLSETNAVVVTNEVPIADAPDSPQVTTAALIEQLREAKRKLADRRQELKDLYYPKADQVGGGNIPLSEETPEDLQKRVLAARIQEAGVPATVGGIIATRGLQPYMNQDTLGLNKAVSLDRDSRKYRAEILHLQQWIAARQQADLKSRAATKSVAKAAAVQQSLVKFQREQAEAGSASYQFTYGQRLVKGDGVETNETLGRAFIGRAAAQGYEPAIKSLSTNP